MTRDPIRLREARPADLDAVSAVFLACWRVSYAGVLPDPVVGLFDARSARELWRPALEAPAAGTTGVVAEGPGGVMGVLRIGGDPDDPTAGHVFSLYVDPSAQGAGIGGRLLDEAVRRFRLAGRREATLWVFTANGAARGFYARHGWEPDGAERVEDAFGEPELRLRCRIAPADGVSAGRRAPGSDPAPTRSPGR